MKYSYRHYQFFFVTMFDHLIEKIKKFDKENLSEYNTGYYQAIQDILELISELNNQRLDDNDD